MTSSQRWKKANPEKNKKINTLYKKNNPEKVKETCRKSNRRIKYGSQAVEHYESQLKKQKGKCALCLRCLKLHQDHNHSCCGIPNNKLRGCGKCNRGLLCTRCNTRLSVAEDREFLAKAKEYLRKWKR